MLKGAAAGAPLGIAVFCYFDVCVANSYFVS